MESSNKREQAEAAAAAWIAKREADEWNEADQTCLDEWIAQSLDHRVAWLRLNASWEQIQRFKVLRADAPRSSISNSYSTPFSRWHLAIGLAAMLVLGVGAVLSLWMPRDQAYRTEIGAVTAAPLSDGSRVTLNTDTQIQVRMTDAERHVQLTQGEAFFEVAKNKARRFVVASAGNRIVAVGTQFSVRNDGDETRVFVLEGKVQVEHDGASRPPVQLVAGDVAHIRGNDVIVHSESITAVEHLLSWRQGYLSFDGTTLADAVAEFNRYNKRKIVIEDPSIAAIRIGGHFRATNTDGFLRLISNDFAINLHEDPDRVLIARASMAK